MNKSDGSPGDTRLNQHETADTSRVLFAGLGVPTYAWVLYGLMSAVGLALLWAALRLESLNTAMRAASGGGYSAADSVRAALHSAVHWAGVVILLIGPAGLLTGWWTARRPSDPTMLRWQRRYRLAPPGGHRRWLQQVNLLAMGIVFGICAARAAAATALAFHLAPGLYDPVAGATTTAPAGAVQVIYRGESVAQCSGGALFLVVFGGIWWRRRNRLRGLESWLDQGVPVCLTCGYPLRGLDSPACPECGADWSQWYPSKDGRPVLPT